MRLLSYISLSVSIFLTGCLSYIPDFNSGMDSVIYLSNMNYIVVESGLELNRIKEKSSDSIEALCGFDYDYRLSSVFLYEWPQNVAGVDQEEAIALQSKADRVSTLVGQIEDSCGAESIDEALVRDSLVELELLRDEMSLAIHELDNVYFEAMKSNKISDLDRLEASFNVMDLLDLYLDEIEVHLTDGVDPNRTAELNAIGPLLLNEMGYYTSALDGYDEEPFVRMIELMNKEMPQAMEQVLAGITMGDRELLHEAYLVLGNGYNEIIYMRRDLES